MIGVCFVYELFVIQKLNMQKIVEKVKNLLNKSASMFGVPVKIEAISNNNHQNYASPHPSLMTSKVNEKERRLKDVYSSKYSFSSYLYDPNGKTATFTSRTIMLVLTGGLLLLLRFKIMGSTLPVFTNFDNPASYQNFPVKQLTWMYLIALNALLLIFPSDLCCDWTMGTVPLVETLADPRNLATISTFFI